MEAIERHVRSWIASENAAEIDSVISVLSSGNGTLLDVVKALGEYLTSEEDALRTKGVQFLSLTIEGYPKDKFNRQAVHVLATFLCSKLEDTETITPALKGLSHLVKCPALASSDVPDIINALFMHVKMRVLVQSTRFLVFSIVDALMKSNSTDLKAMGDLFVSGYATLASGEKDPRNLMVAFDITRVILGEFDISRHVEDYFDITFCYFPITFRSPPNDPYGISADDLKASLLLCLKATPAFGLLGIPLFLEKLTAGSPTTKRDTLKAMSVCLPVYEPAAVREFGTKIWNSLKLEIFQPVDPATEQAALDTLHVFVGLLQSGPALASASELDGMDELVQTVCSDCHDAIGEPEKPQAKAGMKILCSFLTIAPSLSTYAVTRTSEKLVKIFHDPMETSNRASVIILLTDLLNSLAPSADPISDRPLVIPPHVLVAPSKDSLLGLLTVGLKASSTRLPALHGLSALIRIPATVTDDELGYIVSEVGEFVFKEPDEVEDVTTDVLLLLSSIAVLAPQHLANQILPPLFLALPDHAPPREANLHRAAYWRALSSLSVLCSHPVLFETFVVRLTTKLDLLCSPQPSSSASPLSTEMSNPDEMETTAAYAHAIMTALMNTLAAKVSKLKPDPDVAKHINTLLPHLFRLCLEASVAADQRVLVDTRILRVAAKIVRLIIEASPSELQSKFYTGLNQAYFNGQVKSVTGGEFAPSPEEFKPMTTTSTRQRNTMLLYAAAYIPIRRDVSINIADLSGHLKDVINWCSSASCTVPQREAASQLLSSLINKHAEDVSDFIVYLNAEYWEKVINNPETSANERHNAIAVWISIARALLVRSHPSATAFIDKLFALLEDEAVNWDAARAFGALVINDNVLTKRNGAILKVLYAQKYFDTVLPRILQGAENVTGRRRDGAYLFALASVLNAVPKALYTTQMSRLMPLLIRGLDLEDPAIRIDIISILSNTIDVASDERSPLRTYASTLVLAMLKNSTITESQDARVRVAALKYLSLLPDAMRYDVLHPYKTRVLKELGKVLDDPRRAVRKEAVNARTTCVAYHPVTLVPGTGITDEQVNKGAWECAFLDEILQSLFVANEQVPVQNT